MRVCPVKPVVAFILMSSLSLLVSCGGGGGEQLPINGVPGTGGTALDRLDPALIIPPAESFIEYSSPTDTIAEKWLSNYYFTLPPLDGPSSVYQNASLESWANQIFAGINRERAAVGTPLLVREPHLDAVAQAHARNMALNTFCGHTNGYGMDWQVRVATVNPATNLYFGENAAKGQETVQEVLGGWHDSPLHLDNMTLPDYTHVGLGIYLDPTDTIMPMHIIALFGNFTEDPATHEGWINPGPQTPAHDEGGGGSV